MINPWRWIQGNSSPAESAARSQWHGKYPKTLQDLVITTHMAGTGPFIPPRPCQGSFQTGADWCCCSGSGRLVGYPSNPSLTRPNGQRRVRCGLSVIRQELKD